MRIATSRRGNVLVFYLFNKWTKYFCYAIINPNDFWRTIPWEEISFYSKPMGLKVQLIKKRNTSINMWFLNDETGVQLNDN